MLVKSKLFVSLVPWLALELCFVTGKPKKVYLDAHCSETISFHTSELISIANWTSLPTDSSSCTLQLNSYSPYHHGILPSRVRVTVLSVSFPGTSPPCNHSRIDIVDSDNTTFLSGKTGICGTLHDHSFDSSKDIAFIRVTSTNSSIEGKLKILVTAFNTDTCDTKHEFCCDNGRCVDKDVTCDGYDDCGDNSDEEDGCLLSTVVVVIIVIASGLAIVITAVLGTMAVRRKWRKSWGVGPHPGISNFSINGESKPLIKEGKQEGYGIA